MATNPIEPSPVQFFLVPHSNYQTRVKEALDAVAGNHGRHLEQWEVYGDYVDQKLVASTGGVVIMTKGNSVAISGTSLVARTIRHEEPQPDKAYPYVWHESRPTGEIAFHCLEKNTHRILKQLANGSDVTVTETDMRMPLRKGQRTETDNFVSPYLLVIGEAANDQVLIRPPARPTLWVPPTDSSIVGTTKNPGPRIIAPRPEPGA